MNYQNKFRIATILVFIIITQLFFACKNESNPVESTQSEKIETEIKAVLDSIIANTNVPGLVAGIWAPNEGIDLVYTAGVSDLETNEPMDPEMIFRIGSNTKTFTVTVLLQLVDEGKISLDDKLSQYFPDFPRANEVTIEMLAIMRSGIVDYWETDEFLSQVMVNPTKLWLSSELINCARNHAFHFTPGTNCHYSNTNTILIGEIIEQLTGYSLEANIKNRIIDNLNLTKTSYLIAGTDIPGYHSKAYYVGTVDPNFPECSELFDVSIAGASGSMISDIYDLKSYVEQLTNGTFLSDSLHQRRSNCNDVQGSILKYGLGLIDYKGFQGHNGSYPGYNSLMIKSQEKNCTIIVWYNCQLDDDNPDYLLTKLPEIIYADL